MRLLCRLGHHAWRVTCWTRHRDTRDGTGRLLEHCRWCKATRSTPNTPRPWWLRRQRVRV